MSTEKRWVVSYQVLGGVVMFTQVYDTESMAKDRAAKYSGTGRVHEIEVEPEPKVRWINLYRDGDGGIAAGIDNIFRSKELAERFAGSGCLRTVKVEL